MTPAFESAHFSRLRGIIFDCDGVLFDSFDSNTHYYNAILAKLALPPLSAEDERYVHSHTVRESLTRIVPEARRDLLPAALAQVNYQAEVLPWLTPEPGLFDLLALLKARGLSLAVNTNRTTTMGLVAERFGLTQFFSVIVTAADTPPKPDPAGVRLILDQWGLDPAEAAFIGDSEVDEQTALAAGVRFWAYKTTGLRSVLRIPDFFALREAVERHLPLPADREAQA